MTIDELLMSSRRRSHAAMPESDALTESDALQEADLVDVKLAAGAASVAVLFDLRTSLQFRLANTAVLVIRGVQEFRWNCEEPRTIGRVAHYVMGSSPDVAGNLFKLELACLRGWRLSAVGSSAEFFVGDVPGLPQAPPNFIEQDVPTIIAGMPAWGSVFEPLWATFIDPAPSG